MNEKERMLLAFGLLLLVLGGCIGGPTGGNITEGGSIPLNVSGNEVQLPVVTQPSQSEQCEPTYQFSELPANGILGRSVQFSVTARCASGKTIILNIDGTREIGGQVTTDDPVIFNFILSPAREGTKQLVVWSDNDVIYNRTWVVLPLGSTDTSGNKNDPVSVKEWIATRFDIDGTINVKSVGVYMRRLYSQTMESSMVVAEIRPDNNGRPGENQLAVSMIPITETTLTPNWIYFNFPQTVTLGPGSYWVVFRVTQETQDQIVSDVANVHYTFGGDTTKPASSNIKKMNLQWDNSKRRFVETSWEPLAYDRTYAVVLSGIEH